MTGPRVPALVFHGTSHAFERFDPHHLGRCVRNPTTEIGFFFSEDEEDAEYWAHRAARYGRAGNSPRLIAARVAIRTPVIISRGRFRFYLQRARTSTLQRDLKAWKTAGHDGMTTLRDGHRWWAPFNAEAIEVAWSRSLLPPAPDPEESSFPEP